MTLHPDLKCCPLVKCMSLIFLRLQAARGCILLVHWYDWYQWNNPHAIGIPLVKCISLRALEYFLQFQAVRGCILLVHWYDWYDWYQWNIIHSNGIPLVKCISLRGLRIFPSASGCEGVHSTCPLVRLVRLVPMEYHSFQRYSIGDMHIITGT